MGSVSSHMKYAVALVLAAPLLTALPAFAVCAPDAVELRGPTGAGQRFNVEVADTAGERAQGLMNREKMSLSAGMLFVYEAPQHARFWMKNTLIPLDMIFADSAGTVTHVHHSAIPLDETAIDGGAGVQFVLEINGGLAKRMGLDVGHVLRHPSIEQSFAIWPCSVD